MRRNGTLAYGFASLSMAAICLTGYSIAQDKNPRNVQVSANVIRPAPMPPLKANLERVQVPEGFRLSKFADGLHNPRMMAVTDDGTVYVTQREPGTVVMIKDLDGDGRSDVHKVVAEKAGIHGITLHQGKIYFVAVQEVLVADRREDGSLSDLRVLINDLPNAGQHPNRTIAFGPDGKMYVTVGSLTNAKADPSAEPWEATMIQADFDGKNKKVFAKGLRNTIGFGWHPKSNELYGWDHGTDWLGDGIPPEELNRIEEGKHYGWPHVQGKDIIINQGTSPDDMTLEEFARRHNNVPVLEYTAHSSPLQMLFYTGSQFPAEYRNDAFTTMRGSWNRRPPSGYEIVRVRFDESGKPTSVQPFLTGFVQKVGEEHEYAHLGRLCGLAQMPDGSLLFTDDENGVIYRLSYSPGQAMTRADDLDEERLLAERLDVEHRLTVESSDFNEGAEIPERHSDYGQGLSPNLRWSNLPAGTRSVAVVMEDPDASYPKPFVHWLIANIPVDRESLPTNVPQRDRLPQFGNAVQGANHRAKIGYFGPRPPKDDDAHNYHFQVFALDGMLDLEPGFTREALMKAMEGRVLGRGILIGKYNAE